jgi:putative Mg2+ transporter-C (MgtC) family protein
MLSIAALPHMPSQAVSEYLARLLTAAVLGGVVGIERSLKRRPAGLRTNMFICFGAALFTILSEVLADGFNAADRTRIASQIIPGIGFIGAGSILHAKGGVTGLTTAATIFVVASIGMAAGGGLYVLAIFGTVLIIFCLQLLGALERQLNLKPLVMRYSVLTEHVAEEVTEQINAVLDEHDKEMEGLKLIRTEGKKRIAFSVEGTRSEHEELLAALRKTPGLGNFEAGHGREIE